MHAGRDDASPMKQGQSQMMGQGPMMNRGGMMPGMMGQGMMGRGMMMQEGPAGGHATGPRGDDSPSSLAFYGINRKMHAAMDIDYTGEADVDFVQGMIAHHRGAIDMAKTVLAFGKDPEVRKLAEEIIKAQQAEIAFMQNWLKQRGR
jgi:uncharacterized protein (DUF305 family)